MTRAFPAALALACVCTPAMAASVAFDPFGAAMDAVAVFVAGIAALVLLYVAVRLVGQGLINLFSRFSVGVAAIVVLMLLAVGAHPALAQEATKPGIVIPWGQWLVDYGPQIAIFFATWLAGIVSWALAKWAPWATSVLTQQRVEQAAQALAQYGVKAVADSTRDGKVTINAGPAVIQAAVQRGVNVLPGKVVDAMIKGGGMASIIFRVLDLEESADERKVLQPAIATLKASPDAKLAKAA